VPLASCGTLANVDHPLRVKAAERLPAVRTVGQTMPFEL
jgi:hypothetical protein